MEDELVITVIATGFDSDTFRQQEVSLTVGDDTKPAETEVDDEMVKNIDLELDKENLPKVLRLSQKLIFGKIQPLKLTMMRMIRRHF